MLLDNTGETFTATGRELVETGIIVRLSRPMTIELITAEFDDTERVGDRSCL